MSTKHQGHFARKRFGQNFLVDQGVIDSIVDTIAPRRGERMVEIGPGLAALTEPLIERLATPESPLHAVELDRDLIARLEKRFGELLVLHSGDALAFDFGSLALEGEKPSLRIVGNLPYNISSPLLFHLTVMPTILCFFARQRVIATTKTALDVAAPRGVDAFVQHMQRSVRRILGKD